MNVTGIRSALISHALSLGLFDRVNNHEPKSAPGKTLSCEFWLSSIAPTGEMSGLNSVTGRVTFSARVRLSMTYQPQDDIDGLVLTAVERLMNEYCGDFELGSDLDVRCIDLLGMSGEAMSADFGYLNQDNVLYRVGVITIPVIVNDLWSEVA